MRMSVELLQSYLDKLGFSERDYAIGRDDEDKLCMVHEGDEWIVFFSERGSRWDDVSFSSEKVACMYFLGLFAQRYIEKWPRH